MTLSERLAARENHPAGKGIMLDDIVAEAYAPSKPYWHPLLTERAKRGSLYIDEEFEENVRNVADTNIAMLLRKHLDYGPKNIALAPGGALNGLRVRMHDKLARINNLLDKGVEPENESLIDSFLDLANYAIIAQLVIRGEWPNE